MSEQMLQTIRDYFATQPVRRAWLFGSYARGEEHAGSDVDILVDFDQDNASVGLVQFCHIISWFFRLSSALTLHRNNVHQNQ